MKKIIATLFGISSIASACFAQEHLNDYSNRLSLTDIQLVAEFEDSSLDGFVGCGDVTVKSASATEFGLRNHEGKAAMVITPSENLPGKEWRGVAKTFDNLADFSSKPVVSFSIFTNQGPAIAQYVRLRLYSGSKFVEGQTQIIPGLWRNVTFDFTGKRLLKKVDKIEIALMNDIDEIWNDGRTYLIDGLTFGKPLDLSFMIPGSTDFFKGTAGKIKWHRDALVYKFKSGSTLSSPSLDGSLDHMLTPALGNEVYDFYRQRNTFFIVMANKSDVSKVKLNWTTDKASGSKDFEIEPRSGMRAYYFNISDCPECKGYLQDFSITALDGGKGKWIIDQVRFEREEPIVDYAGTVESCTADKSYVTISGTVKDPQAYPSLCIYEYPLMDEGRDISKLKLIYECTSSESFSIADLANSRLDGKMTHLSTRFLAVVKNEAGEIKPVAKPFWITNWMDFTENPYAFTLPDIVFNVLDYGAKGDGYTDDTEAIQKAIDACSKAGGGKVVLPGDDSVYGRRYVATNIVLKSNIEFNIGENAILWQSYDQRNYNYYPAYGHDFDIPNCPWTHCLFINLPLLQANSLENIKVTGPGSIRMADPYVDCDDWTHYAFRCADRMHICPISFDRCKNVQFTDVDILRTNNYNTCFNYVENMFVGNVKMYEVACVSGDGIGLSQGTKHVRLERIVFDSNDDGVTFTSSYKDPRGKVSPFKIDDDDADHSIRDIYVEHSYINSNKNGEGKAIALIPWGSTNPDQTKQLIDSVFVYDCVLRGGHSVGTWCDNPFDGRPFDNAQVDDFCPVQNFRIFDNEYQSLCDILCVKPTNWISDCGLHASPDIVNGDFSQGIAYWTLEGEAGVSDGCGYALNGGRIWQGLYPSKGAHIFTAQVCGKGTLDVKNTLTGEVIAAEYFETEDFDTIVFRFNLRESVDCGFGITAEDSAKIKNCKLTK